MQRRILGLALALLITSPAVAEYMFRPLSIGGGGIGTANGIVKGDGTGNPFGGSRGKGLRRSR